MGLIPDQGTKIPHAVWHNQKKKKKKDPVFAGRDACIWAGENEQQGAERHISGAKESVGLRNGTSCY